MDLQLKISTQSYSKSGFNRNLLLFYHARSHHKVLELSLKDMHE